MENAVSLVEHNHLAEMHASLKRKLIESQSRDSSHMDSVRQPVMNAVVNEEYEKAKDELKQYVEMKTSFPDFQARATRYVAHCCELIQAIQTKRNFPGLAALSLAKQQEVHEKVLEHFEELKQNLKLIERVERENKLTDLRSTVLVLRAASLVVAAIVSVEFMLDIESGLLSSAIFVVDTMVSDASSWLVDLF